MNQTEASTLSRRDEVASAFFGAWVIVGLFLDGWAHNAEKPETFFTPWHGVLYAGIFAAIAWFSIEDSRRRARGIATEVPRPLRLAAVLVVSGGVGDLLWHEAFGIEDDIAALLSPTHLLLMAGGLMLFASPLRSMLDRRAPSGTMREFLPAAVAITCVTAILSFFLQFASPFKIDDQAAFTPGAPYEIQIRGILGLLVFNGLLLGAMAWVLQRWRPPAGTFTLLLGGVALLDASQHGFDEAALVIPAVLGGLIADTLVYLRSRPAVVLTVTPAVMWLTWFGTYHAVWGLGWEAELWTGTTLFAALTGLGLALLSPPAQISDVSPGSESRGNYART